MPKFVKTATSEVLDVRAISEALHVRRAVVGRERDVRLVMSATTREAIRREPVSVLVMAPATCADRFEGRPVDINDSLEFGEVLFTCNL